MAAISVRIRMMKLGKLLLTSLLVSIGIGLAFGADRTVLAAEPTISTDASSALAQMGKTLGAQLSRFRPGRSGATRTRAISHFTSNIRSR
jgi:hypothetical protein